MVHEIGKKPNGLLQFTTPIISYLLVFNFNKIPKHIQCIQSCKGDDDAEHPFCNRCVCNCGPKLFHF